MSGANQGANLIVFLGNPGKQYERTRHNAGWMVADAFFATYGTTGSLKQKFHGRFASIGGTTFLLPDTFMNNSGMSVRGAVDFYNFQPERMLVVHDDLERDYGVVELAFGGGLRGHNGLKSIRQHLKTDQFWRLRVGIGRPVHQSRVSSFVLSRFTPDEEARLSDVIEAAARMVDTACRQLTAERTMV